jgi:Domain of unknown function (DUF1996)
VEERATLAGTSQDGREMRRFWLMGGALLLTLLLGVLLAARPADASTRIEIRCNVYATNTFDPIVVGSGHLHKHIGNRTTTNASSGASLKDPAPPGGTPPATSCDKPWFTSAGWFPEVRDTQGRVVPLVSRNQVIVYYRAPGDPKKLMPIPTGLGILTNNFKFQSSDKVTLTFPDCWDKNQASLLPPGDPARVSPANMVFSRNGVCPSTHQYQIPRVSYVIRYSRAVTSQFQVSSGVNAWAPFSTMHADYLSANQDVFNDELIERCLRSGLPGVDPACE